MKAKQTNQDKIYVYSSFKQFYLPLLEFLVSLLCIAWYWNVIMVIYQIQKCKVFENWSRSSEHMVIWCSCGIKAEIFELPRVTAN